jgi:hypothetical protein
MEPEKIGRIKAEQRADDLSDARAQLETQLTDTRRELSHALGVLDGARRAVGEEQAGLAIEKARAEHSIGERDARIDVLSQESATHQRAALALAGDLRCAEEARDAAHGRASAADATAATAAAERDRAVDEARLSEAARQVAMTAQLQSDGARDAAAQRAEQADRDKGIAEQAHRAAELELGHGREQEAQRSTRLLAATRALIVEAVGRIVRRETEKARRHQATPQKLRAWAHAFYVLHEETCCEILQPAIRAHLALMDSSEDVSAVTVMLVREHIATSMRDLDAVAASEPGDFQALLGKVLNRWEAQRHDALADRLLTEGVGHVRARQ